MAGVDIGPELGTHGALVANHVGPGTAKAGRAHRLVGIHHNVVLCSLNHSVMIMVDDGLAVMVLAVRDDIAHVAALDGVVAVLVHELVGLLHVTLIVHGGRRGLVVHHKADALGMGIGVEGGQVEVRVGSHEVKHVILLGSEPVFPALVPAFDEKGVEAVLGGKVNVAAHVLIVSAVTAMGLSLGIIGHAQLHGRELVGVGPGRFSRNHLPPYAHVLHGMDPGNILQGTGFVEIEDKARSQHVRSSLTHLDGAPGAVAGSLQAAFHALGVGGENGGKGPAPLIQHQVHGRIIQHRSFMDIDVEAVGRFHLQGSLHRPVGSRCLRDIVRTGTGINGRNLREQGPGVVVLLRVIVSGNPPGGVVSGHGKLREFIGHLEIGELVFLRELVAEGQAVVVHAYADVHVDTVLTGELHEHFLVAVTNLRFFSPDGRPYFIQTVTFGSCQGKVPVQKGSVQKLISQAGFFHHRLSIILEPVGRSSVNQGKHSFQPTVGAGEGLILHHDGLGGGTGAEKGSQAKNADQSFHIA